MNKKIGIIGCGNMGEALINGFLSSSLVSAEGLFGCEANQAKAKDISQKYKIDMTKDIAELVKISDVVIIAVKPQIVPQVLADISKDINDSKLIISIAAGVTIKTIEAALGEARIVKVMPNTPVLVKKGMSAICLGEHANDKDKELAVQLFLCVGEVVVIEESLMDAATGINGSGPAYFFYLMEKLIDAAQEHGLSKEDARRLVVQTALGSAMLVSQTDEEPVTLRQKVTSRGGTTEAATGVFEKAAVGKIVKDAITAAVKRSKSLSGG